MKELLGGWKFSCLGTSCLILIHNLSIQWGKGTLGAYVVGDLSAPGSCIHVYAELDMSQNGNPCGHEEDYYTLFHHT